MNYRPKLIATDLDGTIVQRSKFISTRTIEAFKLANQNGIDIVFATGRPPRWMAEIRSTFGFGESICCNGALVWDMYREKIIENFPIAIETQIKVITRLRQTLPNVAFALEGSGLFTREKNYHAKWDIGADPIGTKDILESVNDSVLKILVRTSTDDLLADKMQKIAQKTLKNLVTVTHSNPNESFLEISALGVSKGSTLKKFANKKGFESSDVVAFGDNANDFTMLAWAGDSYAIKGGHELAPKFAKSIADTCENDGVAQVIEQLMKLPENPK